MPPLPAQQLLPSTEASPAPPQAPHMATPAPGAPGSELDAALDGLDEIQTSVFQIIDQNSTNPGSRKKTWKSDVKRPIKQILLDENDSKRSGTMTTIKRARTMSPEDGLEELADLVGKDVSDVLSQ